MFIRPVRVMVCYCFFSTIAPLFAAESAPVAQQLPVSKIPSGRQDVRFWLLNKVKVSCSLDKGNGGFVKRACLNEARDRLVTLVDSNYVVLSYDPRNGTLLWSLPSIIPVNAKAALDVLPVSVAMNKSGDRVVVIVGGDPTTRSPEGKNKKPTGHLLDGATGKSIATLPAAADGIRELLCATFSHDGTEVASGSRSQTVAFWDAQTGAFKAEEYAHKSEVQCINYNPTDEFLVSGGDDALVQLIQKKGPVIIRSFKGHKGAVHTVSFSSDSSKIISGGTDRTARIWDIVTNKCLHTLKHKYCVEHAYMKPDDNNILATSNGHNVIVFWDLRQANAIDQCVENMSYEHEILLNDIKEADEANCLYMLEKDHPLEPLWTTLPEEVKECLLSCIKTKEAHE